MQYFTPANIVTYLIVINLVAFAAFGIDKARAEDGARRISERDLLFFAVIGGVPGAFAGRALFRHKTRKQPFSSQLYFVASAQLVLAVFCAVLWL
ncbi:DUF1294 domain-containing protein [Pontixanthobacter aestiaquae]|uniref:DUF1294 domain-containing protein n=1 Tax=Pontixanthobacter aestiaquae TaxID=1509367 RepID=A0A844Z6F6_9SPHN|nr:DUF1294 domain-containing protein [Pontixanthobacter aestiaquae]MDN3646615.1 DUF1294 domain-containing protein [Pontixanthobacter aestiaquae]MXO82400.1 DUF1294 domain-containing protein [Pontixanthobacter aestiaquae]